MASFLVYSRLRPSVRAQPHCSSSDAMKFGLDQMRDDAYREYIDKRSEIARIRMYEGKPTDEDYRQEELCRIRFLKLLTVQTSGKTSDNLN